MRRERSAEPSILVLGLGSVLMSDDGLGPHAIHLLESRYDFDPTVALLDGGTPGHDLVQRILGLRALLVIDAVRSPGPPGELRLYRRSELLATPPGDRLSPHDPGLREAILTADLAGRGPEEVVLIGLIPAAIEIGTGLSPVAAAALPRVLEAVAAELARLGAPPRPRRERVTADPWWLAAAV